MTQLCTQYKPKAFLVDGNLKFVLDRPLLLSELYHENSKILPHKSRPWLYPKKTLGLEHTSLKTFGERSAKSFKIYQSASQTLLPQKHAQNYKSDLWQIMSSIRSLASNCSAKNMQLNEVSRILFYSCREKIEGEQTAPFLDILSSLDIYLLACGVNDLEAGLYHYNVRDHALEFLRQGNFLEQLTPVIQSTSNEWLKQAKVVLFVTATFFRNQLKYGDHGYRGVLLNAGRLSQNILLTATGLNLTAYPIMGCMDDQVNDFLEIDGVDESILYVISLDHPIAEQER